MSEQKQDRFWDALPIPYQDQEDDYQFANPVVVQRHFLRLTRALALVTQQAEDLQEEITKLENERTDVQGKMNRLRRDIFAEHYGKVTKSASAEIQDAFVLKMAQEEGRGEELEELEEQIEQINRKIRSLKPKLDKLWNRQKAIQQVQEGGRHYLDFEKLLMKLEHNGRI